MSETVVAKRERTTPPRRKSKLTPANWRQAGTRDERSTLIREGLFKAAAQAVGEVGYEQASVSLITRRAGVAHGTFYNHFNSRQDILDQLLPRLGAEMLEHVRDCARKGASTLEREELGFDAFFSFLERNPHFFRILNEAEGYAPNAYSAHLEQVATGYRLFLESAHELGDLPGFERREFEVIAFILMAARSYLAWRFVYGAEKRQAVPTWVAKAYMKFVRTGLTGGEPVHSPLSAQLRT